LGDNKYTSVDLDILGRQNEHTVWLPWRL